MAQWTVQNKRVPKAYINFVSRDDVIIPLEDNTIAAVMIAGSWGEPGAFTLVDGTSNFRRLFGKPIDELLPIREALKGTGKVLVYNGVNNTGVQATKTESDMVVTAKYKGLAGNHIHVIFKKQVETGFEVTTVFFGKEVDKQIITALPFKNDYVNVTGTLTTEDKTILLEGGTDGATTNSEVEDFLDALDTQDFRVLALGTDESATKALVTAHIKKWRDAGRSVIAVLNDYTDADDEGVVSVGNGVTLSDGTKLGAKDCVYFVAGKYAGAGLQSNTFKSYPGAIDCERKNEAEAEKLINKGQLIFAYRNEKVIILSDVNSFTSYTAEHSRIFGKNKLVRTMDNINTNVKYIFENYFIGKVPNNVNGRELFKQRIITMVLDPLAQKQALEYKAKDIEISQGITKESVVVNLPVVLTDAMEILYMTVICD